jgi:cell division protein FtsZ
VINAAAGNAANVIFGAVIDDRLGEEIRITVIATGLGGSGSRRRGLPRTEEEDIGKVVIFPTPGRDHVKELPAFQRGNVSAAAKERREQIVIQKGKIQSFTPDDLEIPTFLRKQMD